MEMNEEELIESVIDSFSLDEVERIGIHALIKVRAEKLHIGSIISDLIAQYQKKDAEISTEFKRASAIRKSEVSLTRNKKGEPIPTIENFFKIMQSDTKYSGIKYNLLTNRAEVDNGEEIRPWTDADAAESKEYIEAKYLIHNESKHRDALRLLFREREYNPVKEIVDGLVWDGKERIEHFLKEWMKVDDSEYTREVSRLIFAGGINRLYEPGCKFDDVPVLIGTNQGEGKSSLIRWLAINDTYFSEVTEIEGREAIEQIEGAWICEVAELLALTKTKEQEAVKSYITRQRDKYRKPYSENVEIRSRRCVFIGTTNNEQFLRDKTGNRRYYPVKTHSSGYWLYEHEQECREYILQCWAEAKVKFQRGEMDSFAKPALIDQYREAQQDAMEDDWRVGAIVSYLDDKGKGEKVCIRQIAHEALSAHTEYPRDPNKAESNEIAQIICRIPGWVRLPGSIRLGRWGKQRCWEKVVPAYSDEPDNDGIDFPFT